jgi:surfeit locus 1 family protein
MNRLRFRPTFWATVVVVPALIVLVALGTWQAQRLHWKNNLIETRAARIAAPPVGLTEALAARDAGALAEIEYRPVTVRGDLRNDLAMRLHNRVRNGAAGGHLVVPVELADGQGTVMVDRGWMPVAMLGDLEPGAPGPAAIDGFVRIYAGQGAFVPDNEPDRNNWFFLDEAGMLAAAGLGGPVGFYVQAGPGAYVPDAFPQGSVPDINLRNSHLEYAVTWYALALVLAVIFVIFHLKRDET